MVSQVSVNKELLACVKQRFLSTKVLLRPFENSNTQLMCNKL